MVHIINCKMLINMELSKACLCRNILREVHYDVFSLKGEPKGVKNNPKNPWQDDYDNRIR
jgi:hypothetical protein